MHDVFSVLLSVFRATHAQDPRNNVHHTHRTSDLATLLDCNLVEPRLEPRQNQRRTLSGLYWPIAMIGSWFVHLKDIAKRRVR